MSASSSDLVVLSKKRPLVDLPCYPQPKRLALAPVEPLVLAPATNFPALVFQQKPGEEREMALCMLRNLAIRRNSKPVPLAALMQMLVDRGMKLPIGCEHRKRSAFGMVLTSLLRATGNEKLKTVRRCYRLALKPPAETSEAS